MIETAAIVEKAPLIKGVVMELKERKQIQAGIAKIRGGYLDLGKDRIKKIEGWIKTVEDDIDNQERIEITKTAIKNLENL